MRIEGKERVCANVKESLILTTLEKIDTTLSEKWHHRVYVYIDNASLNQKYNWEMDSAQY